MRVLLDENLPHDLASELAGHDVATVQGLGWAGIKNGELMRRAVDKIDAFLTMDRNLEHQQTLGGLSFGVVVIRARSSRVEDLRPLIGDILLALRKVESGKIQTLVPNNALEQTAGAHHCLPMLGVARRPQLNANR